MFIYRLNTNYRNMLLTFTEISPYIGTLARISSGQKSRTFIHQWIVEAVIGWSSGRGAKLVMQNTL